MNVFFLILLITLVMGVLPYYFMVHIPKERLKQYRRKLGARHDIKRIIDNLRVNTCLDQVLVWESYNGDGIASFGNKLKISVVEQSREEPFRDVYEDFQGLLIYGDAIDIMMQMQQNGSTARFMHNLNDGIYKRIFEGEGAYWTEWKAIGPGSDKRFFFISMSTAEPRTPYELNQGGHVEIAINKLRNKYKQMSMKPINWIGRNLYL